MGVVIVAIPSSDDRVWSVSSEKKPHLTLLYLGDDVSPEAAAQISKFVEHAAATVLNRFYLEIDKRGTLGKDNADVVFFEGWDLPDLKRFRSYLLMDNTIKKTYLAAEQFPDWLPHLTLGYPTKPAKKLKDDGDRLYSIHFDKIAVWFGDFGGPEFELKKYEHPEVAMSAASPAVENILRHYGVKGMRWGVRKAAQEQARAELGAPRVRSGLKPSHYKEARAVNKRAREIEKTSLKTAKAEKKMAKADKKFDKPSAEVHTKIYNDGIEHFNKKLDGINNKPEYAAAAKAGTLLNPSHPTTQKYHDEIDSTLKAELRASADRVTNKAGTKKYRVDIVQLSQNPHDWGWTLGTEAVQHAEITTRILAVRDKRGLVTSVKADSMAQADIFVGEFLQHYGTKGMKWGVRKNAPAPGTVRVTEKGKKLKTAGGKGFETHPDATNAATTKQKLKGSGPKALSNKELQDLSTRLNLERNVRSLMAEDKKANSNPASKFIKKMMKSDAGKKNAKKAGKSALSKAAAAMVVAA